MYWSADVSKIACYTHLFAFCVVVNGDSCWTNSLVSVPYFPCLFLLQQMRALGSVLYFTHWESTFC